MVDAVGYRCSSYRIDTSKNCNDVITMTKKCSVCNKEKNYSEFYRHPRTKVHEYRCKECKLASARLEVQAKRRDNEFRKQKALQRVYGNE